MTCTKRVRNAQNVFSADFINQGKLSLSKHIVDNYTDKLNRRYIYIYADNFPKKICSTNVFQQSFCQFTNHHKKVSHPLVTNKK